MCAYVCACMPVVVKYTHLHSTKHTVIAVDVGAKMEGGHQVCNTVDPWGWHGHVVL